MLKLVKPVYRLQSSPSSIAPTSPDLSVFSFFTLLSVMKKSSFSVHPQRNISANSPVNLPATKQSSVASSSHGTLIFFFLTALKYALMFVVVFCVSISFLANIPFLSHDHSVTKFSPTSSHDDLDILADEDLDILTDEASEDNPIPYEAYIDIFVRNADLSQPLLQSVDKTLPEIEFKKLQACLRDHPMRHSNVNDDTTFTGTKGFLVSFNAAGINNFTRNPSFSCLETYFRTQRLPNTNAWVLNMVWAEIPDYTRELTIKRHTDDGKFTSCDSQSFPCI